MLTQQLRKQLVIWGGMIIAIIALPIFIASIDFSLDQPVLIDEANAVSDAQLLDKSSPQSTEISTDHSPTAETYPIMAGNMSPSEALTNGKPTLFYFQPYELCQTRYCRHPAELANVLGARYQGDINFVYVTTYAIADESAEPYHHLTSFANWDIYAIPPYTEWIPQPTATEFGLSLAAPELLLIDSSGKLAHRYDEYMTMSELETELHALLSDSSNTLMVHTPQK